MCPAREWADQWECVGEIKQEPEMRHGVLRLGDDPVGEKEKCRSEDYEIIDGEMGRKKNGSEQQCWIAQRQ